MIKRTLTALLFAALCVGGILQPPRAVFADCTTPVATATPVPSYASKVLATQSGHLLAYWILNETGGTTATDSSGNSRSGTYSGPSLNATTFLDGLPAPTFDGVNDYINIYSSSLNTAFNPAELTMMIWTQVNSSSDWTDGTNHRPFELEASVSTFSRLSKSASNTFEGRYTAGGVAKAVGITNSSTAWSQWVITVSKSADQMKLYLNGVQQGSTQTGLGTWSGALSTTLSVIGASDTTGTSSWHGSLANAAVWDTPLSLSEISNLATVSAPSPTATLQPTCTPSPTLTPTNTLTPSITPSNSPSPTLTPSNTPTPSNTANIFQYWTLPPPASTGTAQPGQIVRFDYRITGGQAAIVVLLAVLIVMVFAGFIIWLLMRRR